jgi:hypothetical protein
MTNAYSDYIELFEYHIFIRLICKYAIFINNTFYCYLEKVLNKIIEIIGIKNNLQY